MSLAPVVHLLARAVIRHEHHFLLAQAHGHTTFLPGGHIEPGEGITACLVRELHEEIGLTVTSGDFLGVVEHEWQDAQGRDHYEINPLFLVTCPQLEDSQPVTAREPHLTFRWVAAQDLMAERLMPPPLRALLAGFDERRAWYASTLRSANTA